jgi:hypothetical protein
MKIYSRYNIHGYFIAININNNYLDNKEIIKLLNISIDEYNNFLLSNNANFDSYNNLYFKTNNDCYNCIDKLKEKYSDRLIYLKLTEGLII